MEIWLFRKVELSTLLLFFLIFDTPTPFIKFSFLRLRDAPDFTDLST